MTEAKKIERLDVDLLVEHPANPNRMSGRNFRKLVRHIEASGNYEPVIVRRHPTRQGCFEILNGHHRIKALRQLGICQADCVVWDVTDEQSLMLLATLNRLSGRDDVYRKSELINELSKKFDDKQLFAALPDKKKSIERLREVYDTKPVLEVVEYETPVLLVFMLSEENKRFVESVIADAIDPGDGANHAQRKAWALVKVLRECKVSRG